ncbi:hypothetical protein CRG98_032637 [Punica granatum]|uniref:F-box domain-containing protein n=1 Tax=Punica granatum TaxID=22663 RepID=A0A2I0ISF3_PUNGR|nr:hypothetical protein CRG98_032637 [Punica granatum]
MAGCRVVRLMRQHVVTLTWQQTCNEKNQQKDKRANENGGKRSTSSSLHGKFKFPNYRHDTPPLIAGKAASGKPGLVYDQDGALREVCNGLASGIEKCGQLMELLIAERGLTQSDEAPIKRLLNDLYVLRKHATRIESDVAETFAEFKAFKKQLARSEGDLALRRYVSRKESKMAKALTKTEAIKKKMTQFQCNLSFDAEPADYKNSYCPRTKDVNGRDNQVIQAEVFAPIDQNKGAGCSDRLCDLPDEFLLQILSFLPLEDLVRTNVLSKRWQQLRALVPDLHFENSNLSKRSLFLDFVERANALRGGSAMTVFSLECEIVGAVPCIKKLITSVVTCDAQDLFLLLHYSGRSYVLLSSIFKCATIVVIEVVILSKVIFEDKDSVDKLSSCPSLENLEIDDCDWRKLKRIRISAPGIQHLNIKEKILQRGNRSPFDHLVQINGTCLKSFLYSGVLKDECCILGDTEQLVEAKLLNCSCFGEREVAQPEKLLSFFSYAKC